MSTKHVSLGAHMMTALLRLLVAGSFIVGSAAHGAEQPFDLAPDLVAKSIEPKIKMPKGSYPLNSYARYYAVKRMKTRSGSPVVEVEGTFLYDRAKPGIFVVEFEALPVVNDGLCNVVNIRYSVKSRRILSTFCNGGA